MAKGKKPIDFEVSLLPFIGLMAGCVCMLLLTATWLQVGSIDVKQAVGGQSAAETKKEPALWAKMLPKGDLELQLQDSPAAAVKKLGKLKIPALNGKIDTSVLKLKMVEIKEAIPGISTGLVMPEGEAQYEDIIGLMDNLKSAGITNIGVAPL